ncbi:MAG: PRC-barrel domain-containing protein [Clostridia bacterium]|nr:PRC-barrel domain-containing protein [Clostridia bacterium]MBQ2433800.1 PRC-barrel domain-containing protein [Clostridia bacterium]MBQ5769937.1 PRC-barrel domain-containing protein [Clostridia bacterium]
MRSIRALNAMPAVCEQTGRKIGRVKSVYVDRKLSHITGLSVSAGFGRSAFYPRESISLLGTKAVMISGGKGGREEGEVFSLRRAINVSGELIGAVTNAYASCESLRIECLEISRDVFSDIARGRSNHRRFTVNDETGDAVIYEGRE